MTKTSKLTEEELNIRKKDRRKVIIYVSGAYFGNDGGRNIDKNIETAKKAAFSLLEAGFTVITPHLNFPGAVNNYISYNDILDSCLELVKVSHYMYLLDNWVNSNGAKEEVIAAKAYYIPIVHSIEELETVFLL